MNKKLLKTILKTTLKTILLLAGAYLLVIAILMLNMYWPMIFPDRDAWARDMVSQCNDNFENCVVSAGQVTDFDWNDMYIFRMGISAENVEAVLGFKYIADEYEGGKRRTIFTKNNQVVHIELDFYNIFGSRPNKSTVISYNKGGSPYYISLGREEAIFRITRSDVGSGKVYYHLTPVIK